ncbi:MAG TPA: hypothetical protein VE549_04380 [Myxococcaceae bacterium]|nr:hypothetical protein [Myxococcaceae bacterium]
MGEKSLVFIADFRCPLTDESLNADDASDEVAAFQVQVDGVAVITQTCDIVRTCAERAYVHVAPVQGVSEEEAVQVERGHHPQFVRIPALPRLVADLDRITTVEKAVIAGWDRSPGCLTDAEGRAFARALARKDSRFAFPDDFGAAVAGMRARVLEKHDRDSPEGAALRDHLLEIRVTADPEWNSEAVSVFLTFVRKDTPEAAAVQWDRLIEKWLGLCERRGRIVSVDGTVMTLREMTAQEYVDSDPLDLGHLSLRGRRAQ